VALVDGRQRLAGLARRARWTMTGAETGADGSVCCRRAGEDKSVVGVLIASSAAHSGANTIAE